MLKAIVDFRREVSHSTAHHTKNTEQHLGFRKMLLIYSDLISTLPHQLLRIVRIKNCKVATKSNLTCSSSEQIVSKMVKCTTKFTREWMS